MDLIFGAASRGDLAEVQRLVEEDRALVNVTNGPGGWTPLLYAASDGRVAVVAYLLDQGAVIGYQRHGKTALRLACESGLLEVVRLLSDRGADLTLTDEYGVTPFIMACMKGHLDVVLYLMRRDPECINRPDHSGFTAVMCASWKGHTEVVRALLQAGADPTLLDEDGASAMDGAISYGYWDCVELLEVRIRLRCHESRGLASTLR